MAERLADGLWWLHGTRGSNVFLLEADDGRLALIDTGFAGNATPILADIASVSGGRGLSAILLTHRHFDHSGSAAILRERTGAMLVAGRGDCIEGDPGFVLRPSTGRSHLRRLAMRRAGRSGIVVPVDVAITEPTEVLPGIRAVPVPGHTPGSLCFVAERREAALVGDLVISHGGRLTRSMSAANGNDAEYLRTLADFARTAPRIGLPGHGAPVMDGFGEQLRELGALPRRRATPRTFIERAGRMMRFSRDLWRRRKPARA